MTGEISKYRDFFEADAETFRFLSQVFFKELTPAAIEQLSHAEWPEDTGNANLDAGYAAVKRYFAFGVPDRRQQLAVEYARIFLAAGVFSKEVRTAIPYESVFTSEEHVMMGDSRDDVVTRFREDGFAVAEALHEPEDHLSFELEYLQVMCERTLGLVESGDAEGLARNAKRQRAFIETHILNWLPLLLGVAREYATLTFYTGMLQIAIGAAEQARDALAGIAEDLEG